MYPLDCMLCMIYANRRVSSSRIRHLHEFHYNYVPITHQPSEKKKNVILSRIRYSRRNIAPINNLFNCQSKLARDIRHFVTSPQSTNSNHPPLWMTIEQSRFGRPLIRAEGSMGQAPEMNRDGEECQQPPLSSALQFRNCSWHKRVNKR